MNRSIERSVAWRRGVAALAALAILAAALPAPVAARGPQPQRIAYASDMSGNYDIWVMWADGTHGVNLTNDPGEDLFPAWSPDGRRIAYTHRTGASRYTRELFVMDADGSNRTQLTFNDVADVQPAWSPSGRQLVFVRFGADGNRDLYVMPAVPNGVAVPLVTDPAFFDIQPDWAPNPRIAFGSDRGGDDVNAVYTVRPNGTMLTRLTEPADFFGNPGWAPDGDHLAVADNFCGACPESDLFILDLRDGSVRQLTDTVLNESNADFSPGGDRLAYEAFLIDVPEPGDVGPDDIYVMDLQSGVVINITNSPDVDEIGPDWSPNEDA